MRRGLVSVLAAGIIWVGAKPAAAQSGAAGGLMPLDARHFALLKGDRIVIYEVDPAHGYALQVVNTALLDDEGRVLGQFRPEKPAAAPAAPAPRKAAPRVPPPASEPPAPAPLSARRVPTGSVPRSGRLSTRLATRRLAVSKPILRRQATSPLASPPVQPIMHMAAGPAAPANRRSAHDSEALRTGYLDVASAEVPVPGP
jgi:hypothetical protein